MKSVFVKIRPFTPVILILGLALLLRIYTALYFSPPSLMDEKEYLSLAHSLYNGNGFSINNIPTAYRAPGYPSIIASIFTILGESINSVRIIQALSDTLSCLFIFIIAKHFFSTTTAYIAAFVYAVFPGNLLYVSLLLSEIFFTTLLLGIIVLYTTESLRSSMMWKIFIGFSFASLTLLRQNAPIILLSFVIWESLQYPSWKTAVQRNMIIIVSFIVFLSPWIIRNDVQFNHFSVTSNGGVNFWIGHNDNANGSYRYISKNNPLESTTGEFEKSNLGYKEGVIFLIGHPMKELQLIGLKFAHFFEPDFSLLYSLQFKQEWEKYSNSIFIYREFSPIILTALHMLSMIIIVSAFWTLVYGNEVTGQYILLFGIIISAWVFIHLIFFGSARFRIPIMPLLIILSSYTIEMIRGKKYIITKNRNILFSAITIGLFGSWTAIFAILYLA